MPSRLGRSFRWLLASSWVTNLGDGITLAAGPLLVASQTHNPLAVAMATFLQRLPWLLLGLYAGVVADRLNRRAIVITTGLVRVAILLLLTASILTHRVDIAVVLAALFLFGVNETFGDITTTTLLPMLVDTPDLGIANSRALTGVVVWNQLAGPPVGAALFAAGMALPFVSESVCVLAGVVGGIVIGSALGGLVASAWGVTAPFWFAFAGSAIILAVIWRSLLHIAHADEHARASTPTTPA